MQRKLGLLAGAGSLPHHVIAKAKQDCQPIFVIAFKGHTDPETIADIPHQWFRIGQAGGVVKALHRNSVEKIVFAGAIRRPSLAELRPDFYTARFYAQVARKGMGDDGLLRAIAALLEKEGFEVIGASDLIPELILRKGILGGVLPQDIHLIDAVRGFRVLSLLGPLDVGQAAVVQGGVVLGVEGVEGTDQLIARCTSLARKGSRPVLIKSAKPQQDMRLDMPTIGLKTIEQLVAANFAGIAVESGRTIALDVQAMVMLADRHNLFIAALDPV